LAGVVIRRRFRGPPDSGNGGYVAGLVASAFGGTDCTVTLLRPPPLEQPLDLVREGEEAVLRDGAGAIATAVHARIDLDIPKPPSMADAEGAKSLFSGLDRHIYPSCFVCGPLRGEGDGLRIFPGAAGRGRVASRWTPAADLAGDSGMVGREYLWAALDCPGYFAVQESAGMALLGRMTAKVVQDIPASKPVIVTGWEIVSEGRKHHVGTAIHDPAGRLMAFAKGTWVTLAR
jgi:hypothetical protein